MSETSIFNKLWRRISKYGFILSMTVVAAIAFKTPIQHYVALTRYQHIGITIFLFGMGYVMQTIWSWRVYTKWAKISNVATAIFFCSVGLFFYTNTWLESFVADPTPEKHLMRLAVIGTYLFLSLMVSILWLKWAHEENKLRDAEKAAAVQAATVDSTGSTETTN